MPIANATLKDVTQTVIRPSVIDIVGQIKKLTGITDETPIYFGNDVDAIQTSGSGIDNDNDRHARFEGTRKLEVRMSEEPAEDEHLTDFVGRRNNIPVFVDRALDIEIRPTYQTNKVTLSFVFETKSKEEAKRWRENVQMRFKKLGNTPLHDITYSYTLPPCTWRLVDEIYKKREKIAGYGDRFSEYLLKCMTDRLTVVGNETGTNRALVVSERQSGIQGFFDFTDVAPKPEFDEGRGTWKIGFDYYYRYQCPQGVDMEYPIMIHQQTLHRDFLVFPGSTPHPDDHTYTRDLNGLGLSMFESNTLARLAKPRYTYMTVPDFDHYKFNQPWPGTGSICHFLLSMSAPDKRIPFNLANLGKVRIDPDILTFIKEVEHLFIGYPGKSMFHFDLYRGQSLVTPISVKVLPNLDIQLQDDIDMRRTYRVRMSVFCDLDFVERAAIDRLRKYPKVFQKVFGAINELLFYSTDFQKLGDQNHIYPWQLERTYEFVTGAPLGNGNVGRSAGYPSGMLNAWPNASPMYTDIPAHIVTWYRGIRKSQKSMMALGLIAANRERDAAAL